MLNDERLCLLFNLYGIYNDDDGDRISENADL